MMKKIKKRLMDNRGMTLIEVTVALVAVTRTASVAEVESAVRH